MSFSLPKRTRILWQIRIVFAFLCLCASVALFSRFTRWFLFPAAVIATLGLLLAFVYVPFYFKSYKIIVEDNSIIVAKGLFFKTTNIMPYPRLVFARSFATPLASAMKMKCVMLKAARGWMLIPEIENINADYLLDNLKVNKND